MSGVDQLLEAVTMLKDQLGIADALYRFAAGQDDKDTDTFLSAFTNDAVLDFSHPAQLFGVELPPMDGLAAIATIPDVLAELRTTHTVTNVRTVIDGDLARGQALVEAQHVRKEPSEGFLLLKNTYDIEAVRDAALGTWHIRKMVIRNVWHRGDPAVLFPAPQA
jgi:hypothetical protein